MTDIETLKNFDKDGLIELVISLEKENEKLKREFETTCSNSEKLLLMSLDLLIDEKIKGINDKISVISNDLYAYIDKSINVNTDE
jgi:hypothetical protein